MATILPANILEFIMPIVIFIFIFSIFFAILTKVKIFSDNKPLNSLIAFCVTILFVVVPEARQIIQITTPWFVVFVVTGLLLIMCLLILGIEPKVIKEVAEDNAVVLGVAIGGVIFIFVFALTQIYGPGILQYPASNETGFLAIIKRTVLNPKILGFLIMLIIAGEIVRRVGYSPAAK